MFSSMCNVLNTGLYICVFYINLGILIYVNMYVYVYVYIHIYIHAQNLEIVYADM